MSPGSVVVVVVVVAVVVVVEAGCGGCCDDQDQASSSAHLWHAHTLLPTRCRGTSEMVSGTRGDFA